ncbi:cytochrome C biogenesis protein [Candidatus Daviesbacteria bacterium]|nr:cytochrome C biogenesis protein [Candidatus Daviesbacteria bacterium]
MGEVNLILAFLAGLTSFFAPCVTVLVPAFLSHMAGVSLSDLQDDRGRQKVIFLNTIFFIIGFTIVFVLLGASIGLLSTFVRNFQVWLGRVGGIVIIYLGLASLRLVPSPFASLHIGLPARRSAGYLSSSLVGSSFAIGWTPCVGPVLAAILVLAGTTASLTFGVMLLLAYSVGLMLPFLLVGLFTARSSVFLAAHPRLINGLSMVGGVILIILGILVFTNNFAILVSKLYFLSPFRL